MYLVVREGAACKVTHGALKNNSASPSGSRIHDIAGEGGIHEGTEGRDIWIVINGTSEACTVARERRVSE